MLKRQARPNTEGPKMYPILNKCLLISYPFLRLFVMTSLKERACVRRIPVLFCLERPVAVIKWRPAPHCHRYSWVHSVWMENPDIRLIAWGELIGTSHGCWFLMNSALGPLFGPLRPVALVTLQKVEECLRSLRICSPFVAQDHICTIYNLRSNAKTTVQKLLYGTTACTVLGLGLGLPHCRGFTITFR